jgi:hypothetical protein
MNPIEPVKAVSSYIELAPIIAAMTAGNDRRPKNSLPVNTEGTVQSNNDKVYADVTLYNAHGILNKTKPNSLLGMA